MMIGTCGLSEYSSGVSLDWWGAVKKVIASLILVGAVAVIPSPCPAALWDGLQAYWNFDEISGNTAADLVGSNAGTLNGYGSTPGWTTGKIGGALSFDGSNDFVQVASPNIPVGGAARSIVGWINPTNLSVQNEFLSYGRRYTHQLVAMTINGMNPFFASHGDDLSTGATVSLGAWNQYAMTFDGTTVQLYLNGTGIGSKAIPLNTTLYSAGLLIGAHVQGATYGDAFFYYFNGTIDEVGVWDRALSATEIGTLWNNGDGLSPVPLPSTLLLFGPGLLGLAGWRRFRKS